MVNWGRRAATFVTKMAWLLEEMDKGTAGGLWMPCGASTSGNVL
jgi:hypothetical protein